MYIGGSESVQIGAGVKAGKVKQGTALVLYTHAAQLIVVFVLCLYQTLWMKTRWCSGRGKVP